MQPTYLPWLGYFGLMRSVDLFVFLDSVQFTRRSWQQRNQIKTPTGAAWLTVPVHSKGKRDQRIDEVEIDRSRDFPNSHVRALELNYTKAPHYAEHAPAIAALLRTDDVLLANLNIRLIESIASVLGISTPVRRSSELATSGAKADMLASICDQVGATEYVSPPGSKEYLDASDAFESRGIAVRYFQYTHAEYPQSFGTFLPYMSVVDALFNCGRPARAMIDGGSSIL